MVKELCWECTGLGGPAIGAGYCRVCLGTRYIEMKGVEIYNKDNTSNPIIQISKGHRGFFVTHLGEVFEFIGDDMTRKWQELLPRVELGWRIERSTPLK